MNLSCSALFVIASVADSGVTVEELKALKARRAMTSGHVKITGRHIDYARKEEFALRYDVTFFRTQNSVSLSELPSLRDRQISEIVVSKQCDSRRR